MKSERILVRSVNWLGDAVLSTPALLRLREAKPAAHITLLAQKKLAALWNQHPALDAVIDIAPGEGLLHLARRLRAGRFDSALIFPNSPRSALECFLGRIPRRIGYARALRNGLLTEPVPPRSDEMRMRKRSAGEIRRLIQTVPDSGAARYDIAAHHVNQYLHLTALLGAKKEPLPPKVVVNEEEVKSAQITLGLPSGSSSQKRFCIGLNPHGEYGPAKRWPAERFVAAAVELSRRFACLWLVPGGAGDVELADRVSSEIERALASDGAVREQSRVMNLAGRTNLRELCAVLKMCDLVLTNDSGPMHLAAAVGTPVIAVFGSTSPELTGPVRGGAAAAHVLRGEVPCAPCFRRECPIDLRCMRGVPVEAAVEAMRAVLEGSGAFEAGRLFR